MNDQLAGERADGVVDVGVALPAHTETLMTEEPSDGSFDDPPVGAEARTSA